MRQIATLLAVPAVLAGGAGAFVAQSGASYEIKARVFNAGGHPAGGSILAGPTLAMITLDALGESVAGASRASDGFTLEAGFSTPFLPPGEVAPCDVAGACLVFTSRSGLDWQPERSAEVYHVYRGPLSGITPGWGSCSDTVPGAMATDTELPLAGEGFFYLVTAKNCLAEEGTKGFQELDGNPMTDEAERANASPCP